MRSADDPDDALSSVLAGLSVSARQANLARSALIDDALAVSAAGGISEEQRSAAQQAAHQIVGSAGTFGSRRASELASALETFFAGDEAARSAGLEAARLQLEELRRELGGDHQVGE